MGEVIGVGNPKKICDACGCPNDFQAKRCARCGQCLTCN